MSIQINWLAIDMTPRLVTVPVRKFDTWDETTRILSTELQGYEAVRWTTRDQTPPVIRVAVLNGPELSDGWHAEEFELYSVTSLARRLSQIAVSQYFQSQGASVRRSRFDLTATRHAAEFQDLGVLLKTGVRLRFFAPEGTGTLGFTANWEVRAEFNRTLEDDRLRGICLGMPVLLTGQIDDAIPDNLHEFMDRFVGEVVRIVDDNRVEVWTRTEERVVIPTNRLRLEAKPAVMRELERQLGNRDQGRMIFRRIQELKLVLVNGRRNLNVFRDQLRAIRHFFARDAGDTIVLPVSCAGQSLSIAMKLVPATVETGGVA